MHSGNDLVVQEGVGTDRPQWHILRGGILRGKKNLGVGRFQAEEGEPPIALTKV